jgi:muramidase (phage lysozyme)
MAYDLEEIRRVQAMLGQQPLTIDVDAREVGAPVAAPAEPPTPRGRVPLQSPVTPDNAARIGAGGNPNVGGAGQSLEAQAYREALRTNPGPRPAAPMSAPPVGTGPAQMFQPNGPTVGQRVGEFMRSEAGGSVAAPAAPVPSRVAPAPANPQLRSVIEQAAQGDAANRESMRQRVGGGAAPTAAATPAAMGAPAEGVSPEQAFRDAVRARTAAAGGAAPPVAPPAAPAGAPPAAAPAATAAATPAAAAAAPAGPGGVRGLVAGAKAMAGRLAAPVTAVGVPLVMEGAKVVDVAKDPNMTATDVIDQAARGLGRGILTAAGGTAGGVGGAGLGTIGAGPVGGLAGGAAGVYLGGRGGYVTWDPLLQGAHDAINWGRQQVGWAPLGALAPEPATLVGKGPRESVTVNKEAQRRIAAGEIANVEDPFKPRSGTAAPGAQIAQAATASMTPTGQQQSERANLLAQLEAREKADPGRVLGMGSNNMADPASAYWSTADGRSIRKPVAATQDEKNLLDRLRVLDARGQRGTFDHEGRQYANVQYGLDSNGAPVYRAVSMDGKPVGGPEAINLLRRYDEVQKRTAPLSSEDSAAVARFEERQRQREDYSSMAQQPAGEGSRQAGAPGAVPAQGGQKRTPGGTPVRDTIGEKVKTKGYVPFSFVQDADQRAKLQAFAHAVAGAEGATYDKLVGGKSFDDFSAHPQQVGLTTKDGPSTAAGRYQITATTAKPLAQQLGTKDFGPETQDRMFMQLLHQAGAMPELMAGNFDGAMQKIGGIWQGVPSGKSTNQGKRTPEQWQSWCRRAAEAYGLDNTTPTLPARPLPPRPVCTPAAAPGAPGAQLAAASPAWLDPTNAVEIIRPGADTTMAVPSPVGGPMREIPQAAYAAYRQAAAADPQLAARMQPVNGGVMVDGAVVPAAQLTGGSSATDDYLTRVRAGQNDVVDPNDVKRQMELLKSDYAKNHLMQVKQFDPLTGMETTPLLLDSRTNLPVTPGMGMGLQPTPEDIANLRKRGDKAAFDAVYGQGAADRALALKTTSTKK